MRPATRWAVSTRPSSCTACTISTSSGRWMVSMGCLPILGKTKRSSVFATWDWCLPLDRVGSLSLSQALAIVSKEGTAPHTVGQLVALVTRLCRLHCAHGQCHGIALSNAMPDTMIDAWLARYRHGMFWTIRDDISNEKAPARIRRGALVDWLGPLLAERVGFEPTVMLPLRLISSQVHSTALPPLLVLVPKPAIIATIATVFRV